ncbi:MAG: hypothetical protein AAFY88_08765 [Acidobacteriota bacterium]
MRSPYAIRRPVENAYLVRERDRRLARELFGVASTVLLLGLGLMLYTWIQLEITASGYRSDGLEKRLHVLEQRERRLQLESAELSHPKVIEARAREELGMRAPTLQETLFFEELAP